MRELRELRVLKSDRLRNKCAMTGYGHAELVSVSPTQLNK